MIKGLYNGYQGKVYIFYRGRVQVVLSDVQAGFNMGTDLAATALRVVLRPNQWTEVAYSYVQDGLENHKGQLYALERSGMVDIYTDEKEVAALKAGTTPLAEAVPTDPTPMPAAPAPQKQYFGMQMFTGKDNPSVVQQNDLYASMQKQQELMQSQMAAMTELTKSMTAMMNKFTEQLGKDKE